MKYFYPESGLGALCRLFGKTRQGWYHLQKGKQRSTMEQAIIIKLVEEIREQLPGVGVKKLLILLKEPLLAHNIKIGRDKFYLLLREHNLLVKPKRRRVVTTNSVHRFKTYANLVSGLKLERAEQVWVSDITYLSLGKGFCYLSLVTDAWSRQIMGFSLSPTLESSGPISALRMALARRQYPKMELIHHSDRGIQYCCQQYVKILQSHNISISMAQKGNPYENAQAERINGTIKNEFKLNGIFTRFEEANLAVQKAVEAYNNLRPHEKCKYQTPQQAHQLMEMLKY